MTCYPILMCPRASYNVDVFKCPHKCSIRHRYSRENVERTHWQSGLSLSSSSRSGSLWSCSLNPSPQEMQTSMSLKSSVVLLLVSVWFVRCPTQEKAYTHLLLSSNLDFMLKGLFPPQGYTVKFWYFPPQAYGLFVNSRKVSQKPLLVFWEHFRTAIFWHCLKIGISYL